MFATQSLIVFDGDYSLWRVEALYDEARWSLCRLLEREGLSVSEVERFQRARDQELHADMGYSSGNRGQVLPGK